MKELSTQWPSDEDVLRALAERPLKPLEGGLVCRVTRWGGPAHPYALTVAIERVDGVEKAQLSVSLIEANLAALAVEIRRLGADHEALTPIAEHAEVWREAMELTGPEAIGLRHIFDGKRLSEPYDPAANYRQLIEVSLTRFELLAGASTARVVVDSSCMRPALRQMTDQLDGWAQKLIARIELRRFSGDPPDLEGGEGEPWRSAPARLALVEAERLAARSTDFEHHDDALTAMAGAAGRQGLVCPHCGEREPTRRAYNGHGKRRSFLVCGACKRSFDALQAQATNPPGV